MNDTWYTSPISGIIENCVAFDRMLSTFLLVIFILLQLSFPFYVNVNRVNQERDKNTLIFPLIDHFYGVMKKTQAIFVFLYFTGFYLVVKDQQKDKTSMVVAIIVGIIIGWMVCFYVLMIFTQVFQFLLTIMAIQKFLLYFFPSSQKYIILSGKNMPFFIRFAYYLFIIKDSLLFVLYLVQTVEKLLGENFEFWKSIKLFELAFFASMNIAFFASALLYIPIMLSVRKMSHLRSVQESKPHIYIFWQTMTALVVKMIHTSLFLFMFYDNLEEMVVFTRMFDVFSVPAVIQISYLTCNMLSLFLLPSKE